MDPKQQAQPPIQTVTPTQPIPQQSPIQQSTKEILSLTKTKIVAWMIILINLFALYTVVKTAYNIGIIRSLILAEPIYTPYIAPILTFSIMIIVSIFLLKKHKWAWWFLTTFLVWSAISSLLILIGTSLRIHQIFYNLRDIWPLGYYQLWYYPEYIFPTVTILFLVFMLLERKNFWQATT
jgi:hypothetical protein